MQIKSRSYSSKAFRPKPLVFHEENLDLIILATPWGDPHVAEQAIDQMHKYIQSVEVDIEVTSPFEPLKCLSDINNHLKIAIEIVNSTIYRSENLNQIKTGLEILIMRVKGHQLFWAEVGSPQLLLKRDSKLPFQMLSSSQDLNFELDKFYGDPLPGQLVGLEKDCLIQCGSCRVSSSDRLYLISASYISESSYQLIKSKTSLDEATKVLIQDQNETPMWLGVVDFS